MKCQFQETINEMKKFLNERLGNKFASDDTKDVIRGKLEEIEKLELQLRKLQGTAMVASPQTVEKAQTVKPEAVTDNKGRNFAEEFKAKRASAVKWLGKEEAKYKVATQAISDGVKDSTAGFVKEFYGDKANTGKYSKDDVVYLSTNGARSGRVVPVKNGELQGAYKNIDKAIAAGAKFVADTSKHLEATGKYNVGEVELAKYLESKGYERTDKGPYGLWEKKAVVETKASPILKSMNGVVMDQKGNTTIEVKTVEQLDQLAKELGGLLKGRQTRSLAESKVYEDGFKMLAKVGLEFKPFKLKLMKSINSEGGLGAHNTESGTIKVATGEQWSTDPQHVVLHEYIHRLTAGNLEKYPALRQKVTNIREYLKKNMKDSNWYGLINDHELLAEAMSNPEFQQALSKVPPFEGKSVFETLRKVIQALLDRLGSKERSALTDVIELTIKVANASEDIKEETNESQKEESPLEKYQRIYGGTDDISWMKEDVKADTQAYNGKIDVTDPIASMKVLEERKLQKEKNREVLRMVENPNNQAEQVMNKIHDDQYRSVRNTLDGIVAKIVNPTMITSGVSTLLSYTLDNKLITAGTYDPRTNVIKMSTLTEGDATDKARELVLNKYMEKVYGVTDSMSDEEYAVKAEAMAEDPKFKEVIKTEMQNEAADIIEAFVKAKGSHAVSHELIHAGAVNYMRENPDSELTKNVYKLFEVAKNYYEETGNKLSENKPYWMTSVDEFLAETLTNPVTIQYMNRIQVGKSVRPRSVFQELISTVLQMLGMKPEDTVYQEALQSYMGILQEIAMNKQREKELTDPEKYDQDRTDELKMMMNNGELDEFPDMKQYVEVKTSKQLTVKQLLQGMKDC